MKMMMKKRKDQEDEEGAKPIYFFLNYLNPQFCGIIL